MHSGDSACAIPPPTLSADTVIVNRGAHPRIADALDVVGPAQRAVRGEGRPGVRDRGQPAGSAARSRSSAKATGVPLAKVAARVMLGATLAELRDEGLRPGPGRAGTHVAVKEAVLPFNRFPDVDTVLGPEMRSTGEVMGIDRTFGLAFAKSQAAPATGCPSGAPCSSRSPTATRPSAPVRPPASPSSGSRSRPRPAPPTRCRPAAFGSTRSSRSSARATHRRRRGRAHLVRQGRPRDQHAPRAAGPRHGDGTTSAGRPPRTGVLCDHGRRRPRGRRAWPSCEHPASPRSASAGVPPGPPAPARGVMAPASTSEPGGRHARSARVPELPNPIVCRARARSATATSSPYVRPGSLGAVHGEVAGALRVARQPGAPLHETTAGMLNAVGLQGPGVEHWVEHDLPRAGAGRASSHRSGAGPSRSTAAAELLAAPPELVASR